MMIAGCISQAIKILEGFDEILDGPSPEELVESTHEDIAKLLESPEALEFFWGTGQSAGEGFIR